MFALLFVAICFNTHKTNSKVVDLNPTILIIMVNINGLHIKGQRLSKWILKSKTQLYTAYKKHTLNLTIMRYT